MIIDKLFLFLFFQIIRVIVPLKAAYQILDSDSATVGDVLKCFGQLSQHFNGLEREETRVQMDKAIEVHTPTPPPLLLPMYLAVSVYT